MIVLSGGGDAKQSFLLHKIFAEDVLKKGGKLLYIPGDAFSYSSSLVWIKNVFEKFGLTDITMWTDVATKISLDDFDGIYVGGGNTFNLLQKLRDAKLIEKLSNYIQSGNDYYGSSAGAVLLSRDIKVCKHLDDMGTMSDTSGLNLVNGFDIWCHYNEQNKNLINDYRKNYNKNLILISEPSGLIIENDFERCIGEVILYR